MRLCEAEMSWLHPEGTVNVVGKASIHVSSLRRRIVGGQAGSCLTTVKHNAMLSGDKMKLHQFCRIAAHNILSEQDLHSVWWVCITMKLRKQSRTTGRQDDRINELD